MTKQELIMSIQLRSAKWRAIYRLMIGPLGLEAIDLATKSDIDHLGQLTREEDAAGLKLAMQKITGNINIGTLRRMASVAKIKNWSKMSKDQILVALASKE